MEHEDNYHYYYNPNTTTAPISITTNFQPNVAPINPHYPKGPKPYSPSTTPRLPNKVKASGLNGKKKKGGNKDDDVHSSNIKKGRFVGGEGNNGAGGVKLSTDPQSVAARERRHRISDRFKILQGLVPGGSKLDTVSMLEQAIQYVKYLKAQIWIHQTIINSNHDDDRFNHHDQNYFGRHGGWPPYDFAASSGDRNGCGGAGSGCGDCCYDVYQEAAAGSALFPTDECDDHGHDVVMPPLPPEIAQTSFLYYPDHDNVYSDGSVNY